MLRAMGLIINLCWTCDRGGGTVGFDERRGYAFSNRLTALLDGLRGCFKMRES